ncbi:hypothetical protein HAZT_HAZT000352 [Hyalella azteca]|uniref:Nucleotide exchange factor Fes1 domain-containing protein n=1 Tax=Hyalella azteca TaxID=294128 RepID=A0A6A0GQH1_HYAAZ|nr:hypothetical protein HAZT_HAZT000352 [Hyalella azteca]
MSGEDQQPQRTPRNMQGLLNFCTAITAREDAPNNTSNPSVLDPERRQFLENVLSSMTTNVAKVMAAHLQTLASSTDLHEQMSECEEEEKALDELIELVQDVDNANDLVKMGGFPVLLSCLDSPHALVLELSCEVLAVVCQNNPKCQDELLKHHGVLDKLLNLLDNNASPVTVKTKALFAVSCLIRGHEAATAAFDERGGFSYLMRAMQLGEEKVFIKAIFLIAALLDEYKPAVAQLTSMGYSDLLVEYLCSGYLNGQPTCGACCTSDQCREHCCSALLKLCSVSEEVKHKLAANDALCEALKCRFDSIKNRDEVQEELQYILALLVQLKKHQATPDVADDVACR